MVMVILTSAYSALWHLALLRELLLLLLFPRFPFHSEINKWFEHAESVLTRPTWRQCPASSAPETAESFFLLRKVESAHGYLHTVLMLFRVPPLFCQLTSPTFITTSPQPQTPPAEILLPTNHFINMMLSELIF